MAAGRYDRLVVEQGVTFELPITLERPAGTPWNLTDSVLRAKLRANFSDEEALLVFDVQVIAATAGSIKLFAAASATSELPTGDLPQGFVPAVWDLEILEAPTANGVVTRILEGKAKIKPEATK
jgi:hypothetical protein